MEGKGHTVDTLWQPGHRPRMELGGAFALQLGPCVAWIVAALQICEESGIYSGFLKSEEAARYINHHIVEETERERVNKGFEFFAALSLK